MLDVVRELRWVIGFRFCNSDLDYFVYLVEKLIKFIVFHVFYKNIKFLERLKMFLIFSI